jgi:hypothetical protein
VIFSSTFTCRNEETGNSLIAFQTFVWAAVRGTGLPGASRHRIAGGRKAASR